MDYAKPVPASGGRAKGFRRRRCLSTGWRLSQEGYRFSAALLHLFRCIPSPRTSASSTPREPSMRIVVVTVSFSFSWSRLPASSRCADTFTEPKLQTATSSSKVFSRVSVHRFGEWTTPAWSCGERAFARSSSFSCRVQLPHLTSYETKAKASPSGDHEGTLIVPCPPKRSISSSGSPPSGPIMRSLTSRFGGCPSVPGS